jgi:hypothetical protein
MESVRTIEPAKFAADLSKRAEEIEKQVKALEEAKVVSQETMLIEVSL